MEAHDEVLMNPNRYPFVSLTLKRLAVKIKIKVILDQPMISEAQNDPGFNRWAGEDTVHCCQDTFCVASGEHRFL